MTRGRTGAFVMRGGLQEGRTGHEGKSNQERDREGQAIVGVELQFGQEIAEGDAEESAGGESQCGGRP
jgi:hypothetical protein